MLETPKVSFTGRNAKMQKRHAHNNSRPACVTESCELRAELSGTAQKAVGSGRLASLSRPKPIT
jgi:hypothetical protein